MILIIIYDSISCVDKHFQSLIIKLFSKGRHWNISIVLINQYIKHAISPIVRSNIDYLLYSVNSVSIIAEANIYPTSVNATGNLGSILVWGLIDDSQTPNYSTILTTQNPSWSEVA